jgi:hypothetical protein
MRPIAIVALAPQHFPDAVVASPGQRRMQHLLPGYDLTVDRDVRGRLMARLRRGQPAEHPGADAAEGGDCGCAAGQAGGDDGASGVAWPGALMIAPLANSRISTKTLWSAERWAWRRKRKPGAGSRDLPSGGGLVLARSDRISYNGHGGPGWGGQVRAGWHGRRLRRGAKLDFAQRPNGRSCGAARAVPSSGGWPGRARL